MEETEDQEPESDKSDVQGDTTEEFQDRDEEEESKVVQPEWIDPEDMDEDEE